MTEIDKTKPVLVTGATGYVAGWLVKRLLQEGFNEKLLHEKFRVRMTP